MESSVSPLPAIGGYFELELPPALGHLYPDALRLQSARASLLALLRQLRPSRLWLPRFICPTMLEPVRRSGVSLCFYPIDHNYRPPIDLAPAPGELLLYVNYYGICDEQIESLLQRVPKERVVLDFSQAFFSPPPDCLATIYSPRKFFGVPDGAYLCSALNIPQPAETETLSLERFRPLLTRLADSPEAGYPHILEARRTFKNQEPKRMSQLTERLLASIDYPRARSQRRMNAAQYHTAFGDLNPLPIPAGASPLAYPLYCEKPDLREILAAQRIFVAKYWPDLELAADSATEAALAEHTLALPCDQRYGEADIARVIAALRAALN
ncbi:hypothetical protein [Chromobacterium alticapitis]|uniref:DegT/DnrJ/EryC1/StrS aminotransferase family protein n=1 Tax=Chromobacterium alticapitis TaxID=2073169 RepID=A0A2S5DI16_9NEIS|nr:hypothetical protein [Chromobacterium alticapitis]POZ62638.1 hypothetical protein C2I19_07255 [Chromobacterium alticapitis]